MKKIDIAILFIYVVAMVALYFFWKCGLDPWFAVVILVLVGGSTVWMEMQNHKLKKLQEDEPEEV